MKIRNDAAKIAKFIQTITSSYEIFIAILQKHEKMHKKKPAAIAVGLLLVPINGLHHAVHAAAHGHRRRGRRRLLVVADDALGGQ